MNRRMIILLALLMAVVLVLSAPMAEAKKNKKKKPSALALILDQQATLILQRPPFAATDNEMFTPQAYGGSPLVPAEDAPTDEQSLKNQLKSLLERRFGLGNSRVNETLAIFDASEAKAIVPDPRLRAALVALNGTAEEPAIAGALDGTYSAVRFADIPGTGKARAVFPKGDGQGEIQFNNKYQYEDFRLLASTMAHETFSGDPDNSEKEELVAESIDTLVYAKFLLESPELAHSGTELARRSNTELMARINTRDQNANLRLFVANGDDVLPGNIVGPLPYFGAISEPSGSDTPGSELLRQMVQEVVGSGVTVPPDAGFDDNTLALLDQNQRLFTPYQVLRLTQILKLDLNSSTAQTKTIQPEDKPTPNWKEILGAE
jgi:hypothetical protein